MRAWLSQTVEAIGRNSNLAHLSNKWSDLRERIGKSLPRTSLLYQDKPKIRSKRFLTPQDTTDIVSRYQAGDTTQQVGTHYGISKTRVASVLREQGVIIRRQGLTSDQVREAATLYATGKSLAWIGYRFGVSHTTIAAAFRRQGIQLRPRPGWG
jgi:DNA invertase Pin-like site-specific DNA recombinase